MEKCSSQTATEHTFKQSCFSLFLFSFFFVKFALVLYLNKVGGARDTTHIFSFFFFYTNSTLIGFFFLFFTLKLTLNLGRSSCRSCRMWTMTMQHTYFKCLDACESKQPKFPAVSLSETQFTHSHFICLNV